MLNTLSYIGLSANWRKDQPKSTTNRYQHQWLVIWLWQVN